MQSITGSYQKKQMVVVGAAAAVVVVAAEQVTEPGESCLTVGQEEGRFGQPAVHTQQPF